MKQCKKDGAVRQIEHNNNSFYQFNGHSQPWVATWNSEGERGGRGFFGLEIWREEYDFQKFRVVGSFTCLFFLRKFLSNGEGWKQRCNPRYG